MNLYWKETDNTLNSLRKICVDYLSDAITDKSDLIYKILPMGKFLLTFYLLIVYIYR